MLVCTPVFDGILFALSRAGWLSGLFSPGAPAPASSEDALQSPGGQIRGLVIRICNFILGASDASC